jgi:SAM-dependent methyltransferase
MDADDVLTPVAVAAALDCFVRHPEAALVYGAHRWIDAGGRVSGGRRYSAAGPDPRATLLRGDAVVVNASAVYRRDVLLAIGGFDEALSSHANYDVHLRLARDHVVVAHPVECALWRWRRETASASTPLAEALKVHGRHRPDPGEDPVLQQAWSEGRRNWRAWYAQRTLAQHQDGSSRASTVAAAARLAPAAVVVEVTRTLARRGLRRLPTVLGDALGRRLPQLHVRPRGRVRLGDFAEPEPISMDFGWDRGTPIDRFYIESFLERNSEDIAGRVLEVGDDAYSRHYGGDRIALQDVLHVHEGNPAATIVGDMSEPGVLPGSVFDCIVLTQTLHLVYDMHAAVEQLHRALRPGGILLLTVPGISQIDRGEWGASWYWALTPAAVQRLLGDVFGSELVAVESHGNVFAATTFLQGLAVEEIDVRRLAPHDPAYPVIVTARALKLPVDPQPTVPTPSPIRP